MSHALKFLANNNTLRNRNTVRVGIGIDKRKAYLLVQIMLAATCR